MAPEAKDKSRLWGSPSGDGCWKRPMDGLPRSSLAQFPGVTSLRPTSIALERLLRSRRARGDGRYCTPRES